MYCIDKFSKVCGIPPTTLRYWEKDGLIKPHYIDPVNGYHYYVAEQMQIVKMIRALQSIGMTNREISKWIDKPICEEMLQTQKEVLIKNIAQSQEYLRNIDYHLQTLGKNYIMSIGKLPACHCILSRAVFADVSAIILEFGRLRSIVVEREPKTANSVICFGEYFDAEYNNQNDIDSALFVVIRDPNKYPEEHTSYIPEIQQAVTVIHKGFYRFIGDAYICAYQWIEYNGYRPLGAPREWYINGFLQPEIPENEYITEIQIPIEKMC